MNTADLLSSFETCDRKGYWSKDWESNRMQAKEMLQAAMHVGLTSDCQDFGEAAGETVMELGAERGLETNTVMRIHEAVCSLAAVADLVTSAIRTPNSPPWLVPERRLLGKWTWNPSCYLVDGVLRRICLVSHWQDDRKESEIRSWRTLLDQSIYGLPMQLCVAILGQTRDGLLRGPWTRAMAHPANGKIRFRKKGRSTTESFKDSWKEIKRVDHAEISNKEWLQAMLTDDVLPEVLFKIDVTAPSEDERKVILSLAESKLERLYAMDKLPGKNLSTCDWPVPCVFRRCCHGAKEYEPSERSGFLWRP